MAKSKIIKDLATSKVSLSAVLKQLKLLLVEFENDELTEWVNCELRGYPNTDKLPGYRKLGGVLRGTFLNYTIKATNVSIPLLTNAPKDIFQYCSFVNITDGIEAVQEMAYSNQSMGMQIPSSYLPYIQQYSAISMTALLSASVEISKTQVLNIMSCVENRILDILLILEKEFGCLDSLDIDFTSKSDTEISEIASKIQVVIYNDNSITIGDNNKMKDVSIESD